MKGNRVLGNEKKLELLELLEVRFRKNEKRHGAIDWNAVRKKLEANEARLWSLNEMESTGGEPDVIGYDEETKEFVFCDCSPETPAGRRNLCYDRPALESRKQAKPPNSVIDMAESMGIELLSEEQYRALQETGVFDAKTSSWVKTPEDIRKKGGALFGDYRYGHVFIYHNGAESYYSSRGFRGILRI